MSQTKEILKKIKKLNIKTKQLVDGLITGDYNSIEGSRVWPNYLRVRQKQDTDRADKRDSKFQEMRTLVKGLVSE